MSDKTEFKIGDLVAASGGAILAFEVGIVVYQGASPWTNECWWGVYITKSKNTYYFYSNELRKLST
jgi:hypothetical protein